MPRSAERVEGLACACSHVTCPPLLPAAMAGSCVAACAAAGGTSEKPFGHTAGTVPAVETRDVLSVRGVPLSQTSQCAPFIKALLTRPVTRPEQTEGYAPGWAKVVALLSRDFGKSGVIIYRHWTSRAALLMDACARLRPKDEVVDTGSLRGDITARLNKMAVTHAGPRLALHPPLDHRCRRARPGARAAAGAPARRDQGAAARRGRARQEARRTLVYRRWISREPIDERFVKAPINNVMRRVKAKSGR